MKHLPEGVHFPASGEAKWQQEMMVNFVIAVLAGVMLVFAVLVLLYRRALPPLVNMGSLLLAPLGSVHQQVHDEDREHVDHRDQRGHAVGAPALATAAAGLTVLLEPPGDHRCATCAGKSR